MYHSTLVGQQGYQLIYIPSDAAPHRNTPYLSVDTYRKEIKLYGVNEKDHELKEHFLYKADKQYAREGRWDPPKQEAINKTKPAKEPLERIVKEAELEQTDTTQAA